MSVCVCAAFVPESTNDQASVNRVWTCTSLLDTGSTAGGPAGPNRTGTDIRGFPEPKAELDVEEAPRDK